MKIQDPTSRKQASRVLWLQACCLSRIGKNDCDGSSENSRAAKGSSKAGGAAAATTGAEGWAYCLLSSRGGITAPKDQKDGAVAED